ncbi:hypothetical protein FWF93_02055 [Candidatus Saccharibacteria bacterium]|nr:hypothetical protein [Candidatus Saccharibacteria bacterium]
MIIRKATESDLNSILELNHSLFELEFDNFDDTLKVGWTYEKVGKDYFIEVIKDGTVFVADEENKIAGYLAGSILANSCISEKKS